MPETHALAKARQVRLEKFAREDFVMFKRSEAPNLFDQMTQLCAKAGFLPQIVSDPPMIQTLLLAVAAGIGVAIVPGCVRNFRQPGVTILPVRPTPPMIDFVQIRPKGEPSPTVSAWFGAQVQIRPETLEYAEFVVLLSTLSSEEMKLPVVMEFYRARWQVELAFKRLKSLLEMGQVPKKKEASCRAWMQGKILTALLIERLLCESRFFPHGVTQFEEQSQWSLFKEFRDALLVQLAMPLTLSDLAKHRALLCENFKENRLNRPRRLKRLRNALNC